MSDAQLEQEAGRWHIREYGNRDGSISRHIIIDQLLAKDSANDSRLAKALSITSLLVAVGGLILSIYVGAKQVEDFQGSANSREIDYALRFDDKLSTGKNYEISLAVERGRPLLQEHGGRFSSADLDLFLSAYNQIADAYGKQLISEEILYDTFSDGLLRADQNKEIQDYLVRVRKEDSDYFGGFDELALLFR